jgi:hypothetical protein
MNQRLAVVTLALALSGCQGFVEGWQQRRAEQQAQREQPAQREAKERALLPGSSADEVRRAWGTPTSSTVDPSSAGTIEVWQYFSCTGNAVVRTNVLLVTLVNGRVQSWSITPC